MLVGCVEYRSLVEYHVSIVSWGSGAWIPSMRWQEVCDRLSALCILVSCCGLPGKLSLDGDALFVVLSMA